MNILELIEIGKEQGLIKIDNGRVYYLRLNKDYEEDPEEYIRAATYVALVSEYKYPVKRIDLEVTPYRRDPQNPADIVVYRDDELNSRFIVVENKANASEADIEEARRQGLGNSNLLGATYLFCVCGEEELVFNVSSGPSLRNLDNYRLARLPVEYGSAPKYRYKKGASKEFELRVIDLQELKNKFERCHKAIWEKGKRDPVTAFDEMSKIMFAKIYDEINTPQSKLPRPEGRGI